MSPAPPPAQPRRSSKQSAGTYQRSAKGSTADVSISPCVPAATVQQQPPEGRHRPQATGHHSTTHASLAPTTAPVPHQPCTSYTTAADQPTDQPTRKVEQTNVLKQGKPRCGATPCVHAWASCGMQAGHHCARQLQQTRAMVAHVRQAIADVVVVRAGRVAQGPHGWPARDCLVD